MTKFRKTRCAQTLLNFYASMPSLTKKRYLHSVIIYRLAVFKCLPTHLSQNTAAQVFLINFSAKTDKKMQAQRFAVMPALNIKLRKISKKSFYRVMLLHAYRRLQSEPLPCVRARCAAYPIDTTDIYPLPANYAGCQGYTDYPG